MPLIALVETLVLLAGLYALVGVVFGITFVTAGVSRVDPVARGATWGFRLMILPASAALWPWLAARWVRGGRDHAARHGATGRSL